MKKILLVVMVVLMAMLFLGSCATLTGTGLTPEHARVVEIIDCPDVEQDYLFVLANSWAVDAFVSAESVIEYSDKEAGIIKGKYIISFSEGVYGYNVRSTITIEVKNGAARITIADPYRRITSGMGEYYPESTQPYRRMESAEGFDKNCLPRYRDLIASFKKAIQEPGEYSDNW